MIIKILHASSSDFNGVKYNDKKVEKGTGELTLMKNFPSFINKESHQQEVRDYLKSVSKNEKVKKPQFHAVISTKFQEHSKDELTKVAENFMEEMGYGTQPYIVVFHKDTDNNHIHLVSTRVDKQTGKKINDSFERLKAQKALSITMEKLYNQNIDKELDKLLNYRVGSLPQLETLLSRSGYKISKNINDEKILKIVKNGVVVKTLPGDQIRFDSSKSDGRSKQLKAIMLKYKAVHSNKVFKVEDNRKQESAFQKADDTNRFSDLKIDFESELQKKLKDVFGLDLVFHHKEGNKPFGCTIIDHNNKRVFKGSEIIKMNEIFEFSPDTIDKKNFEKLKDYNIPNQEMKERLIEFFNISNQLSDVKDFMIFHNKGRKDILTYRKMQFEIKEFIKNQMLENDNIKIFTSALDEKVYVVHTRLHYIGELKSLVGEKLFQEFLNADKNNMEFKTSRNEVNKALNEFLFELMKSSGASKDPAENELKKKRKRKK